MSSFRREAPGKKPKASTANVSGPSNVDLRDEGPSNVDLKGEGSFKC